MSDTQVTVKRLTLDDLLMVNVDNRSTEFPIDNQMYTNGMQLLKRVNQLQEMFGVQFTVSSGYRPGPYNKRAGGAANSSHCTCEAVDLHDRDGQLKHKLMSNRDLLDKFNLYMESPTSTPTWVHLTTRRPHSGNRVFIP